MNSHFSEGGCDETRCGSRHHMLQLIVPALMLVDSDAWSGCTVEQRIELGKQGYDKEQVEKACNESDDNFWDNLRKAFAKVLANGLTNGLNKALGGNGNNETTHHRTLTVRGCVVRIMGPAHYQAGP